jgi:hypothetical protein
MACSKLQKPDTTTNQSTTLINLGVEKMIFVVRIFFIDAIFSPPTSKMIISFAVVLMKLYRA